MNKQSGEPEYVTAEKLDEIKEELYRLKSKDRLELAERISHARSLGDLKENAEYHKVKDEQGFLESRISRLEDIVKRAKVITATRAEKVQIGSRVEVLKNSSGEKVEYQIVGSEESDLENKKISHESPLGNALLGKREGETVQINTPGGKASYVVSKIK